MPWPSTVASRLVSGYIARIYHLDALTLRQSDPTMKELPFYNINASDVVRKADIQLFVGGLLKFLAELQIPLEPDGDTANAMTELVEAILSADHQSSNLVSIIDAHYSFIDEVPNA